jgi:hypothetical protein
VLNPVGFTLNTCSTLSTLVSPLVVIQTPKLTRELSKTPG